MMKVPLFAALLAVPMAAGAQSLPASPASSTEKPGKAETAPRKDASGLILTASTRVRYETIDGRPRPGFATSEDALMLRTGIAIEYGPGPLAIGAEMVDSRAYDIGGATQIGRDDVNALELPQAYVKLRLDGGVGPVGKVALEGGRFLLNIGSGRLIATDEYRNTVNGFTGLQIDLAPSRNAGITLFYVLPQERLPDNQADIRRNRVVVDRETFDDIFFGGHIQRKNAIGDAQVEFAYYRLAERDSPGRLTADRHLHTLDARVYREPRASHWDVDVEGAYQFGRASDSTMATAATAPVRAGFAHAALGYTVDTPLKPRIGLFYDYASGNGPGGRFGRFDTLFGSRREDLGPSGTYAGLARENISAPGVRLDVKPGTRFEGLVDYRGIWLASDKDRFFNVIDKTGASGRFAGQQVEGRLRYWILPKHLRLESNFALLAKGRFLETAPQALARDQHWVRLFEVNMQATF